MNRVGLIRCPNWNSSSCTRSPRRLDVGQADGSASRSRPCADALRVRRHSPGMGRRGPEARGWRPIVVGCSVGGSCAAIEVALAAPERVVALVLMGTTADHRPDPDLHAAERQMLREHGVENAWQTYWAPLFSSSVDPGVVAEAKAIALGQSAEAISRGVTAFHTSPSRGAFLKAVRCPVIVVTGADDIAPGPAVSTAQAHAAHRGRVHVIPDCGHYVPLEQPGRLNAILRGVITDQERRQTN